MPRDFEVYLEDIREAIVKVRNYTAGLTRQSFAQDDMRIDAVIRNLEIIGEAAKQLPADFKARHSAISRAQIAGLRNRIVHDYAGIDLKLVWHISQIAIRKLALQIADLK